MIYEASRAWWDNRDGRTYQIHKGRKSILWSLFAARDTRHGRLELGQYPCEHTAIVGAYAHHLLDECILAQSVWLDMAAERDEERARAEKLHAKVCELTEENARLREALEGCDQ